MLGKRVRWLPSQSESGAKRLKANLQDLWASGSTCTMRHASLLKDAYSAGVEECYSRVVERQKCPNTDALRSEALKGSNWPKPFVCNVPMKNKEGELHLAPLAFLLPHELIFALLQQAIDQDGKSNLQLLQDVAGLDKTGRDHVEKLASQWGEPVIPVSIWQDGVPFNWDRTDSIEIYKSVLPRAVMQAGKEPEVPLHSCCTPPGYKGNTPEDTGGVGVVLQPHGCRNVSQSGTW